MMRAQLVPAMALAVLDATHPFGPLFWIAVGFLIVSALATLASSLVRAARRFEGPRLVRCPETRGVVGIELDAMRAAVTYAVCAPRLRAVSCTRWPERQDCNQACLSGIDASWAREHGLLVGPQGGRSHASGLS